MIVVSIISVMFVRFAMFFRLSGGGTAQKYTLKKLRDLKGAIKVL